MLALSQHCSFRRQATSRAAVSTESKPEIRHGLGAASTNCGRTSTLMLSYQLFRFFGSMLIVGTAQHTSRPAWTIACVATTLP